MIELTKLEVNNVSGGMYYTMLGTALGASFTAGWFISMAGKEIFLETQERTIMSSMTMFFGVVGGMFGSVAGFSIDLALGAL